MQDYRCLPTNALKRHLNSTKVSSVYNLVKSCLRSKEVIKAHCARFDMKYFLMEEEWKSAAKIEDFLRNTSTLTRICQNEEKFNAAHVPVMRKTTHDGLSSVPM